jgi:hypothetical protein
MSAEQPSDFVYGAKAIAEVLGLEPYQVFYLLKKKRLPAVKLGPRKYAASRSALIATVTAKEVA